MDTDSLADYFRPEESLEEWRRRRKREALEEAERIKEEEERQKRLKEIRAYKPSVGVYKPRVSHGNPQCRIDGIEYEDIISELPEHIQLLLYDFDKMALLAGNVTSLSLLRTFLKCKQYKVSLQYSSSVSLEDAISQLYDDDPSFLQAGAVKACIISVSPDWPDIIAFSKGAKDTVYSSWKSDDYPYVVVAEDMNLHGKTLTIQVLKFYKRNRT